jgi:hypothetical protein
MLERVLKEKIEALAEKDRIIAQTILKRGNIWK